MNELELSASPCHGRNAMATFEDMLLLGCGVEQVIEIKRSWWHLCGSFRCGRNFAGRTPNRRRRRARY